MQTPNYPHTDKKLSRYIMIDMYPHTDDLLSFVRMIYYRYSGYYAIRIGLHPAAGGRCTKADNRPVNMRIKNYPKL
ncbi:TPA_asm: hypothetical protein G0B32_21705 [Salmonella enterica subsp. houtenae serovar 45:g,z51:-]|uniref:Uncharacterized protein n=1 Tax=Salmonella enterica subsp. houtenae serovar 45:g,z51:- TaxID=1967611 RepID=A0A701US78_SALHO|nr:hypothetical protein [Salmonella enterica subsp. houtenae serovar 45:g,z51:-]